MINEPVQDGSYDISGMVDHTEWRTRTRKNLYDLVRIHVEEDAQMAQAEAD